MNHQRNVEGLHASARKRHEETLARARAAIAELSQTDEQISFAHVSRAAGVSISWLYKQTAIKERIQYLRDQQQRVPVHQDSRSKASESSQNVIIAALKQRIKKLQEENRELRQQLEVAYGQLRQTAR